MDAPNSGRVVVAANAAEASFDWTRQLGKVRAMCGAFDSSTSIFHPTLLGRLGTAVPTQVTRQPYYAAGASARFLASNSLHQPLISVSLKIFPITRRSRPLRLAFSRSRRLRMASSL